MVIAYRTNKLRKHKLTPIEDWGDLWRPELSGKLSMVDSPGEIIGAVLKHMGASYNTKDIDSHVAGGRKAVVHNLAILQKQAVPSASRFNSDQIGGRTRGTSPLIYQWIEFCLQTARGLPFQQQIIPGASPFALESISVEGTQESTKGMPKLETNLIAGVPPPEILSRCEFLEPLSRESIGRQPVVDILHAKASSWFD